MDDQVKRILLVDDEPIIGEVLKRLFIAEQTTDFILERVDTLQKAANRVQKGIVDLIILDLGLEKSEGLNTFKIMYEKAPDIPIIILSGQDELLAVQAIHLGAHDFLEKNKLNAKMIVRVIRYALERHYFRRESIKFI